MSSLPALSHSCSVLDICANGLSEVISSELVKLSTQATDMIRVSGRQVDMDSTCVVIYDGKSKVGFQYNSSGVALDVSSTTAEFQWKLLPDPINLKNSLSFRLPFQLSSAIWSYSIWQFA